MCVCEHVRVRFAKILIDKYKVEDSAEGGGQV